MELNALINRLSSLHDLDETVARLIAFGSGAIDSLERFLLSGKPNVVYQPRRAVVEALGALGAKEALTKFLRFRKDIADPAIRLAEEVVEDAAARELAALPGNDVLETLLTLALPHPQLGILDALGKFACADAIPYFIRALEDDFCRDAAENALRTLGRQAEMALVAASRTPLPSAADERPASRRRRARSLELLATFGLSAEMWPVLRPLLTEPEPDIVFAVSRMAETVGDHDDRLAAVNRLLAILLRRSGFKEKKLKTSWCGSTTTDGRESKKRLRKDDAA